MRVHVRMLVNRSTRWCGEVDKNTPSSPFTAFSGKLPGASEWKKLHDPKLVEVCPITPERSLLLGMDFRSF